MKTYFKRWATLFLQTSVVLGALAFAFQSPHFPPLEMMALGALGVVVVSLAASAVSAAIFVGEGSKSLVASAIGAALILTGLRLM
ncbi:MAG TPA: hypothetical protein VFQ84_12215 [Arenimonas sp.]|uniref:hypothetical protein n=1 Tax=Arenimonas sp. TaxID=1872635 RepID=UPI002D807F79|nr:hypothetical protein [Arenimonas sp.]HEU0154098.1 hypothetical protein [Arenimonas sp.]